MTSKSNIGRPLQTQPQTTDINNVQNQNQIAQTNPTRIPKMTQSPLVNAKQSQKTKFVSCIKINGVPILPPLITPEKRKELRRLKREAIKVEKRLQRERELKQYVSELYNTCTTEINDELLVNQEIQTCISDTFEITDDVNIINVTNTNEVSTKEVSPIHAKRKLSFNVQCTQYVNDAFKVVVSDECKSPVFLFEGNLTPPPAVPKLIRSNSYTLDAPSPALVEFFKRRNNAEDVSEATLIKNDLEITSLDATPRSDYLKKPDCTLQSELNTSIDCFDTSRTETELKNLSDCESHLPISEGLQEFIANNVPANNARCDYDQMSQRSENVSSEAHSDWNSILKKIPSAYSRQILEILERQQMNHDNYDSCDTFDDIHLNPEQYSTPQNTTQVGDTVYYSADEQSTISKGKQKLTREQAANIITAAAKGFLVRRLMKTEKVEYLIQTINEAVLCAMQLHHDTLDHIEEADVELHRRLIQQVSAACYSFHNVFFATSIQDQMSFIAVDRQKKAEKMRRLSATNSNASIKSQQSQKSSRSQKSPASSRQRQFSLRS